MLKLLELVYQQLHLFDKLSFLYLYKGDGERLNKMATIAEHRGDYSSLIQNTFHNNDIKRDARVYIQGWDVTIGYTLAKS